MPTLQKVGHLAMAHGFGGRAKTESVFEESGDLVTFEPEPKKRKAATCCQITA